MGDGECFGAYYYEIITLQNQHEHDGKGGGHIVTTQGGLMDEDYYEQIYKSVFGPEGPTSIEVDIVLVAVLVIFGCCCCSILIWCGWLKGCTDMCWNVVCCGRYSKLAEEAPRHEDIDELDTGDESVEMGHIAHVLMPDNEQMELAVLSEHNEDKFKNRPQKRNGFYDK